MPRVQPLIGAELRSRFEEFVVVDAGHLDRLHR
ncbi:MAG: hypothetical protein RLZZ206_3009 [Cyanobacteriota bacterium]